MSPVNNDVEVVTMTADERAAIEPEVLVLHDKVSKLLDEVSKQDGQGLVASLWIIEDCLNDIREAAASVITRHQDDWTAGGAQ